MNSVLTAIRQQLDAVTSARHWLLALSGGMDSMVLLDSVAQLHTEFEPQPSITAVHVNHGQHANAGQWQAFCAEQCARRGVAFLALSVDCTEAPGDSLEAFMRTRRYQALASQLTPNGVLLTAHHQDDQAETFLLQALRGAGISGLAAMPRTMAFAGGQHLRPLLALSRTQLLDYARAQQVQWIEDDSNADERFARNFIRHQVMPLLQHRWPGCNKTLARSAALCATALPEYRRMAQAQLQTVRAAHPNRLSVSGLLAYTGAQQAEIIRAWIREQGAALPTLAHMEAIRTVLCVPHYKASALVRWSDVRLRRYRDHLVLMRVTDVLPSSTAPAVCWQGETRLTLPAPYGHITCAPVTTGGVIVKPQYHIRFREGGERFHPHGRVGSHPLKKCFQEWGVPPWMRAFIPLLYDGEQCAGVIGYAAAEQYYSKPGQPGYRFEHHL